jgi:hypothetical protein
VLVALRVDYNSVRSNNFNGAFSATGFLYLFAFSDDAFVETLVLVLSAGLALVDDFAELFFDPS